MPATAATLDEFMALNDELAALMAADVPLDLGIASRGIGAAGEFESINAAVARRVSRGESLRDAVANEPSLPAPYRSVMSMGLVSGNFDVALDGANRLAQSEAAARSSIRSAMFYPIIVCMLAYLGLIVLCRKYIPTMEEAYEGLRAGKEPALDILIWLRDTMPVWIWLPPVALVLYMLWPQLRPFGRATAGRLGWWAQLTGGARANSLERLAVFADGLANLLDAETPLAEAIPLAASAAEKPLLCRAAPELTLATANTAAPTGGVESPAVATLPPFLRWALLDSEPSIPRPRALRMAASVYHDAAERLSRRERVLAPILTCVFVAGSVTLLYGLAVFTPLVDLLHRLGSTPPLR